MFRFAHKLGLALIVVGALAAAVAAQSFAGQPTLHVVVIGASQYAYEPNLAKGVTFAAKDASDMGNILQAQEGKLFAKVNVVRLINEGATKANILQALANLRSQVRAHDYVVVFVATHGGIDRQGQYFFTPHDTRSMDPNSVVTWGTLRQALASLPGIRFLILDTCHSAAAGQMSLQLPADGSIQGLVTLAACMVREGSSEGPNVQNGFFTHAVVEALQGKADYNRDGKVTLAEMTAYVANRVAELNPNQRPTTEIPASIPLNLPVAFLTGGTPQQAGIFTTGPAHPVTTQPQINGTFSTGPINSIVPVSHNLLNTGPIR